MKNSPLFLLMRLICLLFLTCHLSAERSSIYADIDDLIFSCFPRHLGKISLSQLKEKEPNPLTPQFLQEYTGVIHKEDATCPYKPIRNCASNDDLKLKLKAFYDINSTPCSRFYDRNLDA